MSHIPKHLVQNALISQTKGTATNHDNESVLLAGNMTGRKQRRVAAAHAKWLKRQGAKR